MTFNVDSEYKSKVITMNTRFNDTDFDSKSIAICSWVTCYVGLGSNLANELGAPVEHLQHAFEMMQEQEKIRTVRILSLIHI